MSEVLFVSSVLLLLIGAMAFYFYSRIAYTERKIQLLETIMLDIKMMVEMEDSERRIVLQAPHGVVKRSMPPVPVEAPVAGATPEAVLSEPESLETTDSEELKNEAEFYNSVIESAAAAPELVASATGISTEYESMSRDEIASLAEKRGLRVTKRMNRQTITSMLRDSDKNSSTPDELGKDGTAVLGSSIENKGAPLDVPESS